jgi:hypothetical protein
MKPIDNEMKAEYNPDIFDNAVVGKYAKRVAESSNVVMLPPDLAKAFPNAEAVSNALRQVLQLANSVRSVAA